MYKWRHLIENFFCKIKEFRRIAMRYQKTDASYSAMIHLVDQQLPSDECPRALIQAKILGFAWFIRPNRDFSMGYSDSK
jgi:hypothetical protein